MPTVNDIRLQGSELVNVSTPIIEPLAAPERFERRLRRFGSHYDTSSDSHLYRFLVALCGDAGAGSLKKERLVARLEDRLESTQFLNLDRIYGDTLTLPRLSAEIYALDPENEILTNAQWNEVYAKDASYRERCLIWMRAIIEGPTKKGIELAAEAATGVECDVFENYRWVENPSLYVDVSETSSRNEFVIIPRSGTISEADRRRIMRLVDKLRPTNTLPTVNTGGSVRSVRPIRVVESSSDRFYVSRMVTGRSDISWPAVDISKGYWIEKAIEKEAPTFAYMDRQETVTYLSVQEVVSSSEHVGNFNAPQRALFGHLANTPTVDYYYHDGRSYAKNIAPVNLSISWLRKNEAPRDNVVVNNYYPLGYFAETNLGAFVEQPNESFWASREELAPATETLTFDFGRERPLNFIDFQICQKPIDFVIEWDNAGTWTEVQPRDDRPVTMAVDYLPSEAYPWHYFETMFDLVETRYVRITFTRRDQRFPLPTSDYFSWSIEVRNARLMHVIPTVDEFINDTGTDLLGNSFRTELTVHLPSNTTDGNTLTYWQSQPNPTRHAVESLYFDLRTDSQVGTMEYLDTLLMADMDERGMSDLETYFENGQVIDEVFIDPVTFGPDMHFYYSNDDTPAWDSKLWMPIPRSYVLKRGYHALPRPIYCKYFKIEFSNLSASPYQAVEYPVMPPTSYRRYPSWVQDYFNLVYSERPIATTDLQAVSHVAIDPLAFGFQKVDDRMVTNFEAERVAQLTDTDPEVRGYIEEVLQGKEPGLQSEVEAQIRFRSPVMWQADLIAQLDPTRALSRVAQAPRDFILDTGWNAELGLPLFEVPLQASTSDQSEALEEKTRPTMFFPRRCRHGYQEVEAVFDRKLAYFVAIKTASFHRRAYTANVDDEIYVESLSDTSHISSSDLVQSDWRYILEP